MPLPFYFVDVFPRDRYAGNQLAVFPEAGSLDAATMQKIAREINFSETTFIVAADSTQRRYRTRIFTPATELPFAGHPTLGTAYTISRHFSVGSEDNRPIVLHYRVGDVPVTAETVNGEIIWWMQQPQPQFLGDVDAAATMAVLNLTMADWDDRFPVSQVSTGLPFIIVPLRSAAAIARARLDIPAYNALIAKTTAKVILMFCPETNIADNPLQARVFTEFLGIPEDPATGSANGCLAAYLSQYRYFGNGDVDIRVEQGDFLQRPSLLYLQANSIDSQLSIRVGGKVFPVATGMWDN
jgi:trans-2,3-dihydro-3-hydroxyanthranilate isomerase